MKALKILLLTPAAISLCACMPQYIPPKTGPVATLYLKNPSQMYTFYYKNAKACTDPVSLPTQVGDFFPSSAKTLVTTIPANQLVTLQPSLNAGRIECGPFTISFVPKANHSYSLSVVLPKEGAWKRAKQIWHGDYKCYMSLKNAKTGKLVPYRLRDYNVSPLSYSANRCIDKLSKQ